MKCTTKYCKNRRAEGRTVCHKCKSRRYRESNPLRACFIILRQNAKRRGHAFSLTFQQFAAFCFKTSYLSGKGRTKDSFSIDRIDNTKGYTADNIQILPLSANSKKHTKNLIYDYKTGFATVQTNIKMGGGRFAVLSK